MGTLSGIQGTTEHHLLHLHSTLITWAGVQSASSQMAKAIPVHPVSRPTLAPWLVSRTPYCPCPLQLLLQTLVQLIAGSAHVLFRPPFNQPAMEALGQLAYRTPPQFHRLILPSIPRKINTYPSQTIPKY